MSYIVVGIIPVGGDLKLREQYPLVQSRCNYNVIDVYSIAEVVQDYQSTAPINRDVDYVFPLPPSAAVCSFKAVIDDKRTIKGIVKEKGEAKRDFDKAVAQGKTAGLLQQEHADVFRVSLGNIKPNTKISVHISFVSIVPHDGSSQTALRITMPTSIAPRYGVAPTNIPWARNSSNRFELTVAIQMNKPVTSVSSPSHPIGLTLGCNQKELTGDYEPSKAFVHLADAAFLDKDIVIVVSAQGLDGPRCSVERWLKSDGAEETTDAYALTLVPKFDLPALPRQEYIFLVDRSGSMGGGRINSVKAALQILLRSLPSRNTTFNIVSFGSHHTSLWPTSQPYSAEAMETASKHVDEFSANYGGTEMRAAIEYAFQSRADFKNWHMIDSKEKVPTSVFVLTDGEAWDLEGLVDCVSKNCTASKDNGSLLRTFVLGVGNEVSTAMCDGIARAGRGTAVYVATGEKPDAKLMGLLKAARGGVIDDLAIEWTPETKDNESMDDEFEVVDTPEPKKDIAPSPQAPLSLFDDMHVDKPVELGAQKSIVNLAPPPRIQQAPKSGKLPIPLYPGFRCSIFAIIKQNSNPGPYSPHIKITGKVLGRDVVFQVPVSPVSVDNSALAGVEGGRLLHTLAAKQLIQAFEDLAKTPENKAEIERLGKRYSLASSVTSFIAIDEEKEAEVEMHIPQAESIAQQQGSLGGMDHRNSRSRMGVAAVSAFSAPPAPRLSRHSYVAAPMMAQQQQQLMQQTPATQSAMLGRVQRVGTLGERLDSLQDKSDSLAASAESFERTKRSSRSGFFGNLFGGASRSSSVSSYAPPPPPLAPPGGSMPSPAAITTGYVPTHAYGSPASSAFGIVPQSTGFAPQSTFAPQGLSQANPTAFAPPPLYEDYAVGFAGEHSDDDESQGRGQEEYSTPRTKSKRKSSEKKEARSSYPRLAGGGPTPVAALTVENLARAQNFDGGFSFNDHHMQFLFGTSPNRSSAQTLPPPLSSLMCAEDIKQTIWSTILTLACLEKTFKSDKDSWEMLAEKATDYILDVLQNDCGLPFDKAKSVVAELKAIAANLF